MTTAASLAQAVDTVNQAFFVHQSIPGPKTKALARLIVQRQGQPGSYRGMFAPAPADFANGLTVFSGDRRIRSRAGLSHILGQEACRALLLLGAASKPAALALEQATAWLRPWLDTAGCRHGFYCCAPCSVALWRHLAVSPWRVAPICLAAAIRTLRSHRLANNHWARFPFYYTLSALIEIDGPGAIEEIRHVRPRIEQYLKQPLRPGPYPLRRQTILQRALARC